jgi:hypothetical protein
MRIKALVGAFLDGGKFVKKEGKKSLPSTNKPTRAKFTKPGTTEKDGASTP